MLGTERERERASGSGKKQFFREFSLRLSLTSTSECRSPHHMLRLWQQHASACANSRAVCETLTSVSARACVSASLCLTDAIEFCNFFRTTFLLFPSFLLLLLAFPSHSLPPLLRSRCSSLSQLMMCAFPRKVLYLLVITSKKHAARALARRLAQSTRILANLVSLAQGETGKGRERVSERNARESE